MNDKMKAQLLAIIGEEANIDAEIDQTLYPKPDWATHQIVRSSGLVEDMCHHGIGHPNSEWLRINDPNGESGLGIHGCDGCCAPGGREGFKELIEIYRRENEKESR